MDIIWAAVIGMGILALSCYGMGLICFERGYVRGHEAATHPEGQDEITFKGE